MQTIAFSRVLDLHVGQSYRLTELGKSSSYAKPISETEQGCPFKNRCPCHRSLRPLVAEITIGASHASKMEPCVWPRKSAAGLH